MLMVASLAAAVVALGGRGAPAFAAPELGFDASCAPDAMRPNESILLTCRFVIENRDEEPARALSFFFDFAPGLQSPLQASISAFDQTWNGEPDPFEWIPTTVDLPDLAAGEVLDIQARFVFRAPASESYGFEAELHRNNTEMDSVIVSWDATPDAAYPPTSLAISSTLITEAEPSSLSSPEQPVAETVEYELAVSNQSDETMTEVKVLYKYTGDVVLTSSEPSATPVSSDIPIATWDVGSLSPGEEARIRVTFAPVSDCAFLSTAMVVTAQGGATEEGYAARPQDNVAVGASQCRQVQAAYGLPNGGAGPPDGGATASPFEVAIALVFVGALAIAGAAGIHRTRRR